jgi:hypothetical protein
MAAISVDQVRDFLRRQSGSQWSGPVEVLPDGATPDEQRFMLRAGGARYLLMCYAPAAAERARRAAAGLRLASSVGIGPALELSDEVGAALGGPVVIATDPSGTPLGDRPLTDEEMHGWLFLLLTLHHLPPSSVTLSSAMSADASTWWQRTNGAWEVTSAAYADTRYHELTAALTQLRAVAGARLEAHRSIWEGLTRRPCHGNPVPANLVRTSGSLVLVEWDGFGLGDPAMEVSRAAALATLTGELTPEQYVRFVSDYLAGMRDLRDETLEERLRVFASVLPLGFCFNLLGLLAQPTSPVGPERAAYVEQVARALQWISETMGIEVGNIPTLVAPLRG